MTRSGIGCNALLGPTHEEDEMGNPILIGQVQEIDLLVDASKEASMVLSDAELCGRAVRPVRTSAGLGAGG